MVKICKRYVFWGIHTASVYMKAEEYFGLRCSYFKKYGSSVKVLRVTPAAWARLGSILLTRVTFT